MKDEDDDEFDVGGIYAPYDYTRSRSTSVESGEIDESELDSKSVEAGTAAADAAHAPSASRYGPGGSVRADAVHAPSASQCGPGGIVRSQATQATQAAQALQAVNALPPPVQPRLQPQTFSSVLFVRRRVMTLRLGSLEWFEFLMERRGCHDSGGGGGCYQFPQIGGDMLEPLVARLTQRHMLRGDVPATFPSHYITSVTAGRTTMHVFLLPVEKTVQPRARGGRKLIAPPNLYWMCESQLATHGDVGPPGAFGVPMAPWSLETFYSLHPSMRYASPTPPLVLYHGTDETAALDIATAGLKPAPRKDAMLGPGVYFGRWDKARDFATHDAGNDPRAVPGVVVRCIVSTGPTLTMLPSMICACGCAKPFVDHTGDHSRGFQTVYIPDDSYGATKRAEWCVKEPDAIVVDGIFTPC